MDIFNCLPCHLLKDSQAQDLIRVSDVDQMVRDTCHFLLRRLGSADIHAAVEETRIGRNDLAVQTFGKLNGKLRFANSGGADDEDKWRFKGSH